MSGILAFILDYLYRRLGVKPWRANWEIGFVSFVRASERSCARVRVLLCPLGWGNSRCPPALISPQQSSPSVTRVFSVFLHLLVNSLRFFEECLEDFA